MSVLLFGAGVASVVLSVVIAVLLAGIVINLMTRVPFAGTPQDRIEQLLDDLKLQPRMRIYDLGCGDGRVVFAAARRGARATGFEIQPLTYLRAKINQLARYPTAEIRYGNFYRTDLGDANIVFCFLVDSVMPRVARFLERKLTPGCTVVSYGFPLPNWEPENIFQPTKPNGSVAYMYVVRHKKI